MEPSQYSDLLQEYLPAMIMAWEQEYNGGSDGEPAYLYDRVSRREFSATGDFASVQVDNVVPMAHVIDYDSSLPLIRNEVVSIATGEIPKLGVEIQHTEKDLTEIDNLMFNFDRNKNEILRRVFRPLRRVYLAQKERNEWTLKQLMSTGFAVTDPTINVGTNVRLNAGYLSENQFNASVVWPNTGYTPLTDLEQLVDKADSDGNPITKFYLTQATLNQIARSEEAIAYAYPLVAAAGGGVPLTATELNRVTEERWGYRFEVVKGTQIFEKNGVRTPVNSWEAGQIVGVTEDVFARNVWARLAEDTRRKGGVDYQEAEEHILLRKYAVVHPAFGEFTSSQSRNAIVIASPLYKMDTTQVAST